MAEIFKDARKREFLNAEGADRPLKSPIPQATLVKARGYRKRRLVDKLGEHDCAAILLYDPVNIRYALDVSNMQLWMTHNASHYALVCADGYAIAFEYGKSEHSPKASRRWTRCAQPRRGSFSPPAAGWPSGSRNGPTKSSTSCVCAAAAT